MMAWGYGNAIAKQQCTNLHVFQVIFIRGIWMFLFLAPWIIFQGIVRKKFFRSGNIKLELIRGACGFIDISCLFFGFTLLPLAEGVMLYFIVVFFVVFLSFLYLREKITKPVVLAIGVGFVGVIIITQPHEITRWVGALFILVSSFMEANVMVISKILAKTDTPLLMIFYHTLVITIFAACLTPFFWQPITWGEISMVGVMCLLGLSGQYCFIKAYTLAPATLVAPFIYTQLVWAILFGSLFWNESLSQNAIIGGLLIVLSGIYIFYKHEKRHEYSQLN